MNKHMKHIGHTSDFKWSCYRNTDGFIEGWRKIGEKDVERKISRETTIAGFEKFINGFRKRTPVKDKPLKPSQLPPIPFPDNNA